MYEPYKSSKTVTHEDFGGRIFATINTTTAVHAQKMKMFKAFSWAKNTARGVRFLLGFNMYLCLAQCEQVYLFFGILPINIIFLPCRLVGVIQTRVLPNRK